MTQDSISHAATRYHFRPAELVRGIPPGESGLEFLSCRRIELDRSTAQQTIATGGEEVVLVCIAGQFDYEAGGNVGVAAWRDTLYLPWRSEATIGTDQEAVILRIGAPCDRDTHFAHIPFADVDRDPRRHNVFGEPAINSLRDVHMIIDDVFAASRLLVGIAQGRPGGWTSWPPHEHGLEKEELYVYFDLAGAFGVQLVYEDLDNARCFLVREGDMVAIPGGFHPNVGCPAGRIAYVYAMAARVPGERAFQALRFHEQFGDRF